MATLARPNFADIVVSSFRSAEPADDEPPTASNPGVGRHWPAGDHDSGRRLPTARSDGTPRQVLTTAGYLVDGAVGTALLALGALFALDSIQRVADTAVYFRVGPSDSAVFAILFHVLLTSAIALTVLSAGAEYVDARVAHREAFLAADGTMAGLLLLFVGSSVLGEVGYLFALLWVVAVGLGVPLLLVVSYDVRSGGLAAFLGGVPVVVFLVLLAGFGIGWAGET